MYGRVLTSEMVADNTPLLVVIQHANCARSISKERPMYEEMYELDLAKMFVSMRSEVSVMSI